MKIRSIVAVASIFLLTGLASGVRGAAPYVPGWDPDAFRNESTLQIMTTSPEGEEHWSTLWLVVIDHYLYIRLNDRAWDIVQKNKTIPWVKVRIGGKEFEKVLLENAPDRVAQVADLMAEKYWLDIVFRHEEYPCTARLIAQPTP
jgi:hypothetical protein